MVYPFTTKSALMDPAHLLRMLLCISSFASAGRSPLGRFAFTHSAVASFDRVVPELSGEMKQRESDDEPVLGKHDSNSEWSDSDLLEFETDMAELPKTELVTVDSKRAGGLSKKNSMKRFQNASRVYPPPPAPAPKNFENVTYLSNGNDRDVLRASHTCQGAAVPCHYRAVADPEWLGMLSNHGVPKGVIFVFTPRKNKKKRYPPRPTAAFIYSIANNTRCHNYFATFEWLAAFKHLTVVCPEVHDFGNMLEWVQKPVLAAQWLAVKEPTVSYIFGGHAEGAGVALAAGYALSKKGRKVLGYSLQHPVVKKSENVAGCKGTSNKGKKACRQYFPAGMMKQLGGGRILIICGTFCTSWPKHCGNHAAKSKVKGIKKSSFHDLFYKPKNMTNKFKEIDRNHNKLISVSEWSNQSIWPTGAGKRMPMARKHIEMVLFRRFGKIRNGNLSVAEFKNLTNTGKSWGTHLYKYVMRGKSPYYKPGDCMVGTDCQYVKKTFLTPHPKGGIMVSYPGEFSYGVYYEWGRNSEAKPFLGKWLLHLIGSSKEGKDLMKMNQKKVTGKMIVNCTGDQWNQLPGRQPLCKVKGRRRGMQHMLLCTGNITIDGHMAFKKKKNK